MASASPAPAPPKASPQVVAFYYGWYGNPAFDGQWIHWNDERLDIVPSGGKGPQNLAITPDGRFLLCVNMPSNTLVVFKIDADTGRLTPVGQPTEIPLPTCIMIVHR